MGKGSSETVTSQNFLDPKMMAFRGQAQAKANEAANQRFRYQPLTVAGVDPNSRQANEAYRGATGGIGIGMDAMQRGLGMQWNADSAQQYMDPYQSQVMNEWNKQFSDMGQSTFNDINEQAIQGGAFGGARHGVAQGVAQAELDKAHSFQTANMLQQGYKGAYDQFSNERNAAMQSGQSIANLGFAGAQGQMQFGELQRQLAQMGNNAQREEFLRQQGYSKEQSEIMNRTMAMSPYGTSGSQTTESKGNLFSDIAGLGLGVASFFSGGSAIPSAPQLDPYTAAGQVYPGAMPQPVRG